MPLGQESHFNSIRYLSAHVIRIPREMNPLWTLDRRDELARQLLSELDLQPLITHTYDFKEAPQVYRMLDENPGDAISVILRCPDAN